MTPARTVSTSAPAERSDATARLAGAGFVLAGVLLAVGGLPFAIGVAGRGDGWVRLLLGWPAGGVVLLVASLLLAVGVRGEPGIVGRSVSRRAALVVSGAGPLLLIVVFFVSWSVPGLAPAPLIVAQLLSCVTTAAVAVTLLRADARTGVARWGFAALALVDVVALVLALVPQTAAAYQFVVVLVRPLVVIVVGALLALPSRPARETSATRALL